MSAVPFAKVGERSIYIIVSNYNTTAGFTATLAAPWGGFYVELDVRSSTGSPGALLLIAAPAANPLVTTAGYMVDVPQVVPVAPGSQGARIRVESLTVSVGVQCYSCNSSNYYTIDLYLARE
jgi:hypothetical protein